MKLYWWFGTSRIFDKGFGEGVLENKLKKRIILQQMPTIFIENEFRFFFYSNENNDPAHVHVVKGGANGKIWLSPKMEVTYLHGFSSSEAKEIESIISVNIDLLIKK